MDPTGIGFLSNNGSDMIMSDNTDTLGSGFYVIQIMVAGETKTATIISGNN